MMTDNVTPILPPEKLPEIKLGIDYEVTRNLLIDEYQRRKRDALRNLDDFRNFHHDYVEQLCNTLQDNLSHIDGLEIIPTFNELNSTCSVTITGLDNCRQLRVPFEALEDLGWDFIRSVDWPEYSNRDYKVERKITDADGDELPKLAISIECYFAKGNCTKVKVSESVTEEYAMVCDA